MRGSAGTRCQKVLRATSARRRASISRTCQIVVEGVSKPRAPLSLAQFRQQYAPRSDSGVARSGKSHALRIKRQSHGRLTAGATENQRQTAQAALSNIVQYFSLDLFNYPSVPSRSCCCNVTAYVANRGFSARLGLPTTIYGPE